MINTVTVSPQMVFPLLRVLAILTEYITTRKHTNDWEQFFRKWETLAALMIANLKSNRPVYLTPEDAETLKYFRDWINQNDTT